MGARHTGTALAGQLELKLEPESTQDVNRLFGRVAGAVTGAGSGCRESWSRLTVYALAGCLVV